MRLILIYRPSEGGGWVNLDAAVSVQPVPKAAYRSDFRWKTQKLFVRSAIRTWDLSRSTINIVELAATWRWPTLTQMNHSELSHMAGAVDDSTINIVVVIIIIIIVISSVLFRQDVQFWYTDLSSRAVTEVDTS